MWTSLRRSAAGPWATICAFGCAALTLAACGGSGSATPSHAPVVRVRLHQPSTSTHSTSAAPAPPSPAQLRAEALRKVHTLTAHLPHGGYSIAALNTKTGAHFTTGATRGMWTASCYKLFILETMLLQHQRSGSQLSSYEVSEATTMIENSDNVAGYNLFLDVGGNSGLDSAKRELGMKHTIPGRTDPTFTTTAAPSLLALLKNLDGPGGPLDANARSFALGLMRNVEADQRWGVGVLADPHTTFANKNGWLSVDDSNGPGEDDNGLWVVNSAGIVTAHHQQLLVAVMTEHQRSFGDGIHLVQALSRAIAPTVVR